jgi:hypothetical protein
MWDIKTIFAGLTALGSAASGYVALYEMRRKSAEVRTISAADGSSGPTAKVKSRSDVLRIRGWLVAALIFAVISLLLFGIGKYLSNDTGATPTDNNPGATTADTVPKDVPASTASRPTTTATSPPTLQPIQITDPPKEQPPHRSPHLIQVKGSGDIPQGHHLWIFVRAPVSGRYYPQESIASPASDPWEIQGVNVGTDSKLENDKTFTIYALTVNDKVHQEVTDFTDPAGYTEEQWRATLLQFVVDQTDVKRM